MSQLSKMKMRDILESTILVMGNNDIIYYCEDIDVIEGFFKICNYKKINPKELEEFFCKYEDKIDKEKFVLLLIKNYKDNINNIGEIEGISNEPFLPNYKQENVKIQMRKEYLEKVLERTIKRAKGINKVIGLYVYDEKEKRYKLDIVDSREIIDGKYRDRSKKLKRFDEIDSNEVLNNLDDSHIDGETEGIEWLTQSMLLTDLYEVFPDEQFGDSIRTMILENKILNENLMTKEELEHLREANSKAYIDMIDSLKFKDILCDTKRVLREYVEYIDIDKLLMISAYRFRNLLENKEIKPEDIMTVKVILCEALKSISNDKMVLNCKLQDPKDDSYALEEVRFSVKDLKQCLKQFTSNSYLTQAGIKEYKEKLNNGELSLCDVNPESIDIIFTQSELEKLANLNDDNFNYVSKKLHWNKDEILQRIKSKGSCSSTLLRDLVNDQIVSANDIVELYMSGIIGLNQIGETKRDIDLSGEISPNKLNQYYNESVRQESKKQNEENDFDKYLALYKEVLIKDNQKEIEHHSSILMEIVVEEYKEEERESYIQKVERYYTEGILTLNSLIEWDDERTITRLYNDKLITLEDIRQLVKDKKLSFDYMSNKYSQMAFDKNIDYDERLGYIKTGYVGEEDVFKLFEKNLIFEDDLNQLARNGIIREEKLREVINNRTKESLENQSAIKLGNLNMLTKRNHDIYSNDEEAKKDYDINYNKKPKFIIDPNERAEFINLFRAYKADAYLEEDNPFYNYEFYVIPDESGKVGLNSVVIAERYYEDKETEEKFAVNNATYFFKYKDLMVLSNLKKSEMIKERKNIVFTANHNLATEERNGRWAANVIYGIAKTMMSLDLKEYSRENQRKIILEKLSRVYSHNEIMKILDKATEIDLGEYVYEIEESNNVGKRNNKTFKEDNGAR